MPTSDPVECLVEIAALCMDRMNGVGRSAAGVGFGEVGDAEAFMLGQISGICCRVDAVMDGLREREAQQELGGTEPPMRKGEEK